MKLLRQGIMRLWRGGRWGRLLLGVATLMTMCCCCSALALVAGDPNEDDDVVELPTEFALTHPPTAPADEIATSAPQMDERDQTPTEAPAPTATETPTVTHTAIAVLTTTATMTLTATVTETPTAISTIGIIVHTTAPTWTPHAPVIVRPTNTAIVTPTYEVAPIGTLYTVTGASVRPCPRFNGCDPVLQVGAGDALPVIGYSYGDAVGGDPMWYVFMHEDQAVYIHSSVVDVNPPTVQEPTARPTSVPAAVPPPHGVAVSCLTGFDFAVCTQYVPVPRNCAEVVDRGIPERVAACCWPARDGDKDGVACYGS